MILYKAPKLLQASLHQKHELDTITIFLRSVIFNVRIAGVIADTSIVAGSLLLRRESLTVYFLSLSLQAPGSLQLHHFSTTDQHNHDPIAEPLGSSGLRLQSHNKFGLDKLYKLVETRSQKKRSQNGSSIS